MVSVSSCCSHSFHSVVQELLSHTSFPSMQHLLLGPTSVFCPRRACQTREDQVQLLLRTVTFRIRPRVAQGQITEWGCLEEQVYTARSQLLWSPQGPRGARRMDGHDLYPPNHSYTDPNQSQRLRGCGRPWREASKWQP